MRPFLIILAVLSLFAIASVDASASDDDCRARDTCCKVCNKGKACGDTCISRDKQCHQHTGCACDSDEICE